MLQLDHAMPVSMVHCRYALSGVCSAEEGVVGIGTAHQELDIWSLAN